MRTRTPRPYAWFRHFQRRRSVPVAVLIILLAVTALGVVKAQSPSGELTLREAWILAGRAGQYRFTSQVTQTTLPAPRLANVGQTVRENHLTVQGLRERRAGAIQLSVWDNPATAFDPDTALEVVIEDGQARGRAHGGEWQGLEDFSDAFAPGGDVAGYLLAARHVSYLGTERREMPAAKAMGVAHTSDSESIPPPSSFLTHHYHFVIDGYALSAYLTAQLEAEMRRKGELPPGMSLSMSSAFRQIAGSGEAWLDEDGLPLRLRAEIEFPEARSGERILVNVQTDFTEFDRSGLFLGATGLTNRARAALFQAQQSVDIQLAGAGLAAILLLLAAILFLRRLPYAKAQALVSMVVLATMLTAEVAQAAPLMLPVRRDANAPAQQQGGGQKPPSDPSTPLKENPLPFDTQRDPLAAPGVLDATQPGAYSQATADPTLDGPDADRDGLPDTLETPWGTGIDNPDSDADGLLDGEEVRRCPDRGIGLANGQLAGANAKWPGCANPKLADTDADGLTDNQEAVFLGTGLNDKDADGDGLGDAVEVRGFGPNGGAPYSNPLNPDTDGDGLLDGRECPAQPCQNSDGVGDADLFAFDNDGDGFIGSFDLSPTTALGAAGSPIPAPFTNANPFQFDLANLSAGKSVFVDFQIRPTNATHIGFGQSVLDWPTGDTEGQIQRRLDTTFADADPLPPTLASPDPYPQSYGDMRLTPMLEIVMDGTRAPLPRTAAAQTISFRTTPLLAVIQLIKQTEDIKLFGFTVSEPEDLRVRANKLSADYSNFLLEIHQGSCESALSSSTPVYTAPNLAEGGEVRLPGAELAVIADGGHVALLKAAGLSPAQCLPIAKVIEDATQSPLNFLLPVQEVGSAAMKQVGGNVQVDVSLPGRSGPHSLVIFEGSCQERGAILSTLPVTPGGTSILSAKNLVALADGNHAVTIKKDERTLACSSLGNVVNGASAEIEMIDAAAMAKLGITVSEADAAGALIAHIPLSLAYDPRTGVNSGFAGTMLYNTAAATSWQHRVRLSWWVQVLTDNCTALPADFMAGKPEQERLRSWCGANANQVEMVHVYDDSWQLAGLSVREEHDYDMAIVFEDPATDANRNAEDYLWHLAQGLDEQFVTGVDCVRLNKNDACSQDGQRDYTLSTVYNTFDNGANAGVSDSDRWGIPRAAFHVEKLDTQFSTYLDQGQVMGTSVPNLLKARFLQNGQPLAAAPVLLFASESKFRSVALGAANYATVSGAGAKIDFDPANEDAQAVLTIASLSWAPYRYRGSAWESYPFEEYWDLLASRLKDGRAFSAGDDADSRAVAAGKIRLAQTYFAYLYSGRAGLVQSDATVLGQWNANATAYISRNERQQRVLDAGDLAEVITQGSLVNQVLEPLAEAIAENFDQFRFQQTLMQREGTARILGKVLLSTDAVSDNTTISKMWANIAGDTGDSLSDTFFRNFRPGSLSRVGGKVTAGVAAGLAGAAVLAGIAGGIYSASQGSGFGVAQQVLNGVGLATEIAGAVEMLATANKALEAGIPAGQKAFRVVLDSLVTTERAAKIAGLVGLFVGELVNYTALIVQLAINGLTVGSLAANQLAANSIASTVVAGMMFALASTGIGAIVVAIIGLIDGLINLICGFLDEEQAEESIPGMIFCQGVSGWLTQLVSFVIYAQNEITRVDDPYRLNYLSFQPDLANPAAGFVPSAPMSLAMKVRNVLSLAHLPVNIGIFYGYQFDDDSLQSARFAYDIVTAKPGKDAIQLHDSVEREAGPNPWSVWERDGDNDVVAVYADTTVRKDTGLALPLAPGLNRKIPAYLAEGYAVPVQECVSNATFTLPVLPPVVVCWVRSRGDTNYNDLNLEYDVFPPTLDEFYTLELAGAQPGRYRQNWAHNDQLPFPALIDADGDGLRYDADRDDSRWDADGDGLSDAVEQKRSTNPGNPDSDEDGLPDVQEAIRGTDANAADSDGDGLPDGAELAGWSIGYGIGQNGALLTGWAFSDPLTRDIDQDAIPDALEKVYGFNPNVSNDPTVLLYEGKVAEPKAPLLLARFEETTGAVTFADASSLTTGNTAACVSPTCPTAGMRGRFGNAVFFDGATQYLAIPANKAIGDLRTNITLSAWVKPGKLTGRQAVIHIGPGGPNGLGGLTFGLNDDDLYLQFEGLAAAGLRVQPLAAGALALNQWSHIAVEIYGAGGQLYFDANGVLVGQQSGLVKAASIHPEILIGAAQQPASTTPPGKDGVVPNVRIDYFAGAIDEVLIQGWVADDQSSIDALFAGRYNPNDAIVRPGQQVVYESYLENALMARGASGRRDVVYPAALTDQPSAQMPFALEPARSITFADAFTVKGAAASGPYTLTQSVGAIVSIPARDVWKDPASNLVFRWQGPQLYVGASNTASDSNQPVNLANKSFTIAAWVKPINNDAYRRGILGRNSGQNNAFPYLLTVGNQLKFGFGTGLGSTAAETTANDGDTDVLKPGQWNFVAVRYNLATQAVTFFANGAKLNTVAPFGIPNPAFTSFLIGRSSNLGKVTLSQFNLTCEGDGIGDGEYDIIGNGENLWQGTGTEPRTWPLNIEKQFNDSYIVTVCEDDDEKHATCEGWDENMGGLFFSSNNPSIASTAGAFANPTGKTECAYDWGSASYPDIATLTYSFSNDSLPFLGELRDIEVHTAALSDMDILNIGSHGDKVAQFRMDEIPGAAAFKDYIAFHQLSCSGAACPQTGADGTQNVSALFDGSDDFLEEGGTVSTDDKISSDIARTNSGFAVSVWIKPAKPAGAVHNSVINIATFDNGSVHKGDLNLVHKTTPTEGYVLFYKDWETDNPFSQLGNCAPFDEVEPYDEWTHVSISMDKARQTANLYVDGQRCSTPQIPLAATYIPKRGDRFTVGRSFADPSYLAFKGNIDDLHIHRKPLTPQEVLATYRQGTYRHWSLDEPANPPTEPVKGLMRRALQFRRFDDRYFVINDRADIFYFDGDTDRNPGTPNPITFALWVKAEDLANRKRPLLSIQTTPFNVSDPRTTDFMLYLEDGVPKIRYYQSNTGLNQIGAANKKITENVWQHLVFRKDDTGKMAIFVNGYKASDITTNWDFSDVRRSGGVALGADLTDSTFFKGRIDELLVYRAALTDQEIRELYNYQNSWVDESIQNGVTVDAEAPTSTLQLKTTYFANAPQLLHIVTAERTTVVSHVELGVDAGGGVRWVGATRDETDAEGNTWLPLFEPAGEGTYTLSSRATDLVGNTGTPAAGQTVLVDGKPPIVNINAVASLVRPQASNSEEAVWYLYLVGASFDPIIPGANQPGSGTAAIDVSLSNGNGDAATLFEAQRATVDPATGEWVILYKLNAANPTGEFWINAVAVDKVGNQATATPIKIRIDTTAPEAHVAFLISPTYQQAVSVAASDADLSSTSSANSDYPGWLGSDSTIGGLVTETPDDVVDQAEVAGVSGVDIAFKPLFDYGSTFRDQPLPASTLLYLPLDESSRTDSPDQSFADVSPARQNPLTCAAAACPLAGVEGRSGQALDFDGVDDSLTLAPTPAINGLTNDFTVAAWIKPDSFPRFTRFVSLARTNSANGFGFGARDRRFMLTTYGVKDYFGTADVLTPGVWQHVAVHLNANNGAEFYVNGLLVETVPGSGPGNADADDRLLIGATTESGAAATSQHFDGAIDEVMIGRGRPSAADWETMLGANPTLRLGFDTPFIHPNAKLSNDAGLAIGDAVYLANNLPADQNLRVTGVVGVGALHVDESEGALIGGAAPGVLPHQNGSFTMAFWLALSGANDRIAFWLGHPSGVQNRVLLTSAAVTVEFTGQPNLVIPVQLVLNGWHHVALTYDGSARILYLDGREIGRDTIGANALDTLAGGVFVAGGTGYLDDLRVYRYALNAFEAKALAETGWRPAQAALAQAGQAEATWSAAVPAGLEGFYELQTRGVDALGNVDAEPEEIVTWRGIVDSLAPRLLSFTATPSAAGVDFALTVEDFDLAAETIQKPLACVNATALTRKQFESPWYLAMASQTADSGQAAQVRNRAYQATVQCQASFATTGDAFTICDIAGNCTQATYTGPNVGTPPRRLYLPFISR